MKIIKQCDNSLIFPYIAYIPVTLSDHPAMIIQLHGAGERGSGGEDLEKVLVHGLSKTGNEDNLKDCILIMPQCPTNTFWAARVESIRRFIDLMIEKYSVDTSRIYLCGLSMGGYGTWFTAMAYPELFAAIAPCCGGGMAWYAAELKMPVWAFHGADDTVVFPHSTIEMVEGMRAHGLNVKFDLYEGVGHNSWERAFTEELIEWFLSHHK